MDDDWGYPHDYGNPHLRKKKNQSQPKLRIAEHATVVIHLGGCHQQLPRAAEAKQRLGVLHRDQRITGTVDKQHGT